MTCADTPTRRVFVALPPDTTTRNALMRAVAAIEQMGDASLRPLPAEDWHITLRFIGAIDSDRLAALKTSVHDIAPRHQPLSLRLAHIEPFPSAEHPRVLAATGPATPEARALVRDLETACRTKGLRADTRGWRSHLTLARIRGRATFDMAARPIDVTTTAHHLLLMESVVVEQQQRHVAIATWRLGE